MQKFTLATLFIATLSACGGGGSNSDNAKPEPTVDRTLLQIKTPAQPKKPVISDEVRQILLGAGAEFIAARVEIVNELDSTPIGSITTTPGAERGGDIGGGPNVTVVGTNGAGALSGGMSREPQVAGYSSAVAVGTAAKLGAAQECGQGCTGVQNLMGGDSVGITNLDGAEFNSLNDDGNGEDDGKKTVATAQQIPTDGVVQTVQAESGGAIEGGGGLGTGVATQGSGSIGGNGSGIGPSILVDGGANQFQVAESTSTLGSDDASLNTITIQGSSSLGGGNGSSIVVADAQQIPAAEPTNTPDVDIDALLAEPEDCIENCSNNQEVVYAEKYKPDPNTPESLTTTKITCNRDDGSCPPLAKPNEIVNKPSSPTLFPSTNERHRLVFEEYTTTADSSKLRARQALLDDATGKTYQLKPIYNQNMQQPFVDYVCDSSVTVANEKLDITAGKAPANCHATSRIATLDVQTYKAAVNSKWGYCDDNNCHFTEQTKDDIASYQLQDFKLNKLSGNDIKTLLGEFFTDKTIVDAIVKAKGEFTGWSQGAALLTYNKVAVKSANLFYAYNANSLGASYAYPYAISVEKTCGTNTRTKDSYADFYTNPAKFSAYTSRSVWANFKPIVAEDIANLSEQDASNLRIVSSLKTGDYCNKDSGTTWLSSNLFVPFSKSANQQVLRLNQVAYEDLSKYLLPATEAKSATVASNLQDEEAQTVACNVEALANGYNAVYCGSNNDYLPSADNNKRTAIIAPRTGVTLNSFDGADSSGGLSIFGSDHPNLGGELP